MIRMAGAREDMRRYVPRALKLLAAIVAALGSGCATEQNADSEAARRFMGMPASRQT